MTWLRDAKNFDVHRNLRNAQQRLRRAERQASEAWAAYEETQSTRELWRWDRYADKAQMALAGISRAEALIRISNSSAEKIARDTHPASRMEFGK